MGISVRIVQWLRDQGHDARHLREEALQQLPNGAIFQKAADEQRIILTCDLDFGEIVAISVSHSSNVILFRLQNTRTGHVRERLQKVLEESAKSLEQGAIIIVEESRFRIRRLPLGSS